MREHSITQTNYIKRNLYEHKNTLTRCKIVAVFTSGKVIARNKQGTKFNCNIGDLQRVY